MTTTAVMIPSSVIVGHGDLKLDVRVLCELADPVHPVPDIFTRHQFGHLALDGERIRRILVSEEDLMTSSSGARSRKNCSKIGHRPSDEDDVGQVRMRLQEQILEHPDRVNGHPPFVVAIRVLEQLGDEIERHEVMDEPHTGSVACSAGRASSESPSKGCFLTNLVNVFTEKLLWFPKAVHGSHTS